MSEIRHDTLKTNALQDSTIAAVYNSLEPERELLMRLAQIRQQNGKTQELVATKMGTSKSNISRLEKNIHSPTLSTLINYVEALGYRFELVLTEAS